jgi:hypothetical protein
MGFITRSFEAENNLTVFAIVGKVDAEQILGQIISFLTGEPTHLVLWDISAGTLAGISSRDLQMIVNRGREFADRRKGGRTAIVCSRDVDYGLSGMLQTFAELIQIPFDIAVSRNMEEARE